MRRRLLPILAVGLLVSGVGETARGYPIAKGTWEVRPSLGALANLGVERRQEHQVILGVDLGYSFTGPWSFLLGTWVGFGDEYVGFEVHADVKYRILKLHPKVAPFVSGGLGFIMGFTPPTLFNQPSTGVFVPVPGSADPLYGFGVRIAAGLDYFLRERIIPFFQLGTDLGYRFAPGQGFLGSIQVITGVSFLL